MRSGLSPEDLGDLFDRPLVGVLATHWADGSVLLSPVWQEWRNGGFNVWTGANDVKARHIRRDPRATLLLAESELPYRSIEVRTNARLITDGVVETARRIASRYVGAKTGVEYVGTGAGDVIVRLEPGEMRAWDFRDDFDSG